MPDLRQQLQTYVEDNIERFDAEDVTATIGRPGTRAALQHKHSTRYDIQDPGCIRQDITSR